MHLTAKKRVEVYPAKQVLIVRDDEKNLIVAM